MTIVFNRFAVIAESRNGGVLTYAPFVVLVSLPVLFFVMGFFNR